ncbi:MAG: hypothetical protein R3D55_17645 [Chloroflexota bacterium]
MDKTNLNTNVTIIGIIVTIISTLISIVLSLGNWNREVNWNWVFLAIAFVIDISLIYRRRRKFLGFINAIKPKPKLDIIVHDITCYVSTEFRQEDENPNLQSYHIALTIQCAVKIKNIGKTSATQILGEMSLNVNQDENSFTRRSKRTVHSYQLAKRGPARQETIVFEKIYFPARNFTYYPNASYCLEYNHQCYEHPNKQLKATYKSSLQKSDWVGQKYIPETEENGNLIQGHWVHDEDVLKIIRSSGFVEPS